MHWDVKNRHKSWRTPDRIQDAYITLDNYPYDMDNYIATNGYNAAAAKNFYTYKKDNHGVPVIDKTILPEDYKLFNKITNFIEHDISKQFMIVNVNLKENWMIFNKTEMGGHANCFIIDRQYKKIIYFEPHGNKVQAYATYISLPFVLQKYVNKYPEWTFETNLTQDVGQWQLNDDFCALWSMIFALLYVLNPEIDMIELYKQFASPGNDSRYIILFTFLFWSCNDSRISPIKQEIDDMFTRTKLNVDVLVREFHPNAEAEGVKILRKSIANVLFRKKV